MNNKAPKLSFWDVYIKEPVKKWAGIQNEDGGIGKIQKHSRNLERELSNTDMSLGAYIREQTKIIATAIKTGNNNFDDFEFALKKIAYKIKNDNGCEVKKVGYHYPTYLEEIIKINNVNNEQLKAIMEQDYIGVTGLQDAIDYLKIGHENLRVQKNKIDKTIDLHNNKR